MPGPTAITWAGSWPEPEPWMIDTLSSRGMSARMIRLYSGTYFSIVGFASAMPFSISGTKACGSFTNFFTIASPQEGTPPGVQLSDTAFKITATAVAPASTESRERSPV